MHSQRRTRTPSMAPDSRSVVPDRFAGGPNRRDSCFCYVAHAPRKNRNQASYSLRRGSSRNCLYVNGWLPTRTGRAHMGGFGKAIALGLGLRHDWGSQYRAKQFQAEIKWLGIRSTSAYVGEPECNGVAERFIRTLKEECIHLHDFDNLEEARAVIGAFIERYNNGWLLQRHGYLTPARAREKLSRRAA